MNSRGHTVLESKMAEEQLKNATARTFYCMDDPSRFISKFVKIRHPVKGSVPFTLHNFQENYIDVMHKNRFSIHVSARQMGLTSSTCGYLLWEALFNNDHIIANISPNIHMARDFIDRILSMYDELPVFLKPLIADRKRDSIRFSNGTIILSKVATPHAIKGMTVSTYHLDNFSCVDSKMQEEIYSALAPVAAWDAKLIITGIIATEHNTFHKIWQGAINHSNDFAYTFTPWDKHPDHDGTWQKAVEFTKFAQNHVAFAREFECQFVENYNGK